MAYKLVIDPGAEKDLEEVLEWYKKRGGHLVFKFLEKYEEALNQVSSNPEQFQRRYAETRIVFLHSFPYGVHYIVEEAFIYVLAVMHTKRKPGGKTSD